MWPRGYLTGTRVIFYLLVPRRHTTEEEENHEGDWGKFQSFTIVVQGKRGENFWRTVYITGNYAEMDGIGVIAQWPMVGTTYSHAFEWSSNLTNN